MVRAFHAREEFLSESDEQRRRAHVAGVHELLVDVIQGYGEPEWRLCNAVWATMTLSQFGGRCLSEVEADGILRACAFAEPIACNSLQRLISRKVIRRGMADLRLLIRRHSEWHETISDQARDMFDRVQIFANQLHILALEQKLNRAAAYRATLEPSSARATIHLQPANLQPAPSLH